VARALARDIKLLLLYEPYERIVQAIKQRGITTIIVEQNAVAALELANALILDRGHIVFDGTAKAVLDNAELRNEYLAI
jgi:branched-chain amino acid transport system ATP-binding protein